MENRDMKKPMGIFNEFMQIEDREDMITYLRSLPKKDIEWPEEKKDIELDVAEDTEEEYDEVGREW